MKKESPKRLRSAGLLVSAVALLAGCASPPPPPAPQPRSYVVLLENPQGGTGQVTVKGSKGEQVVSQAGFGTVMDGSQAPATVPKEKLARDFAAAQAARPALPEKFLLYFESGGTKLTAESTALLSKILEVAGSRSSVDMSVIGHSDTVGKADANESLSLNRANSVAEMLKSRGLKLDALTIESHGEKNLLVPTPDETPEPRNRRVEVSVR